MKLLAQHRGRDLLGGLRAHVENLRAFVRQGGTALGEESLHHTREAGSNADRRSGGEGFQSLVAMRCHLAEIGHGFKAGAAVAEALQDFIFDALRNDLGIGAAAVEEFGGCAQGERKRTRMAAFAVNPGIMQTDLYGLKPGDRLLPVERWARRWE